MITKDIPFEMQGRFYHNTDLIIDMTTTKINKGDLIYVKDPEMYFSGHLLIADQDFDKAEHPTYGFRFKNNPNYGGICGRNEWIQSFVYPVTQVNALNPLIPTFCQVAEIKDDTVIVESEDKRRFLIKYPRKIISGSIGNVIWGRVNDEKCDFAAYDSHYPINSIEIK